MSFKDLKRNFIIDSAKKLFLSKSISEITIKDISIETGLGEATIYRYFSNKENLVIAVSLSIQKDILGVSFVNIDTTGIEQITSFFNLYKDMFIEHREYFKFIAEFDTVYLKNIKTNENNEYSLGLDAFYDIFIQAYNTGLKDKSINKIVDIKLYYYTCTHSLLELCKKLALADSELKQDNEVNKLAEIEYLISLFIMAIKA